ncbi:MAG: dihydroorotate dehydrogenase [Actinobacteria bacterium]|nr:dihydroorotate dehydrogenase [Actinomycetota bacterium]
MTRGVDMSVRLGPVTLSNPVVAASGTYGHGDEVARMGDPSRIGAVTVKSLSADPWPGNPAPRVHETPSGMLNSVGLQNPGVDVWRDHELPALLARGARVIASIWGRTVDDFARAAKAASEAAGSLVALEVNVSCPNLEDRSLMFAHSAEATGAAIAATVGALSSGDLPVLAKLSPNVTDLRPIAGAALEAGALGLTLVNTVMGMAIDPETGAPRLGAGGGGLSGAAIRPVAVRAVFETAQAFPGVPIVGTGGVSDAASAVEMLRAGASAVGVGTATFRDPRAPERIAAGLERWCRRLGIGAVSELVGSVQ